MRAFSWPLKSRNSCTKRAKKEIDKATRDSGQLMSFELGDRFTNHLFSQAGTVKMLVTRPKATYKAWQISFKWQEPLYADITPTDGTRRVQAFENLVYAAHSNPTNAHASGLTPHAKQIADAIGSCSNWANNSAAA